MRIIKDMNKTTFTTRIAFAIVLSAVVASLTACDSINSALGQKKEEDNGMLLAALALGSGVQFAPVGGTTFQPDMNVVTWTDLTANVSCGGAGCHATQRPTFDATAFRNYAQLAKCTQTGYSTSPLFTQLRSGGTMYRKDSGISNNAAPFIAGWIANGCQ